MKDVIKTWYPWLGYEPGTEIKVGDVYRFMNRLYMYMGNKDNPICPIGLMPLKPYSYIYLGVMITNKGFIERLISYYNDLIYQRNQSLIGKIKITTDNNHLWRQL